MPRQRLVRSWFENAEAWTRAVRDGLIESRRLATDQAVVEALMMGLRLTEGIDLAQLGERFAEHVLICRRAAARAPNGSRLPSTMAKTAARKASDFDVDQ